MSVKIRNLRLPDDYTSIAELISIINIERINWESLQNEDSNIPKKNKISYNEKGFLEGFCRERVVAVNDSDQIIGYAVAWHAPWTPAGVICSSFYVFPSYKEDVWVPLIRHIKNWSLEIRATSQQTEINDELADVKNLFEQEGFLQERHLIYSRLNLENYDPSHFYDHINLLENEGFSFNSFTNMKSEEVELQMYELWKKTFQDIPGPREEFKSFDQWRQRDLYGENVKTDLIVLAWYDDQLVGLSQVLYNDPMNGEMLNEYTGVHKKFRGRGLAQALKIKLIDVAVTYGANYMITGNDSRNLSMIRVNKKLGYKRIPGDYIMSVLLKKYQRFNCK